MSTEHFSPDESLKLIRNMIDKTREEVSDDSKYFLVWGWGAFLACISEFILKVIYKSPDHYKVWYVTFVCLAITIVIALSDKKREKVKTYVGESMGYLWSGLGITFLVVSILFSRIGWEYCYPFFMVLYGLGTFVSGKILKYPPLVIGGLISFMLAAISAWVSYDYQILCAAGALLASYIIPAHLLRQRFQKSKKLRQNTILHQQDAGV